MKAQIYKVLAIYVLMIAVSNQQSRTRNFMADTSMWKVERINVRMSIFIQGKQPRINEIFNCKLTKDEGFTCEAQTVVCKQLYVGLCPRRTVDQKRLASTSQS